MKNLVTSLDYAKTDREQINRATVGDGLVITRDGSVESLTSLNRDTGLAQEVTQDDKIHMGIYFDSNLADGSTWKTAWTGVNTLAGLTYGFVGSVLGDTQAEYKDGALQFTGHPWGLDDSAVTLGQVIIFFKDTNPGDAFPLYQSPDNLILELHEREHIKQAEKYGPFYLPAYFFKGGWWNNKNSFEQDANSGTRKKMQELGIYHQYQ